MASARASTAMPQFLAKNKDAIMESFADLEWSQNRRYLEGRQQPYRRLPGAQPSRWARLTGYEILQRNRYANIDPFHSNRVKLRVKAGDSDYINASPIALESDAGQGERRYIACQGPTIVSSAHMWQMVAQHTADPAVLVMLTQTHDGHKEKCWPYFPTHVDEPMTFTSEPGNQSKSKEDINTDVFHAKVTLISHEFDRECQTTVRTMRLDYSDPSDSSQDEWSAPQTKTVIHFLFEKWPDYGVPEGQDRMALLDLVHKTSSACGPLPMRLSESSENAHATDSGGNPRIVHCSAGVGRSGTFIALDYLLAELEAGALDQYGNGRDRIAETVDCLREQRMMMVQGEIQYQFLYQILRDEWLRRAQSNTEGNASPEHL